MLGSCWFCPGLPPPAFGMESTHLYLTQAWTCLWDTATPGQSCRYSWPAHSRACPGSYLLHVESQFRCSYASIGKSQFVKIHDRFFPSIWFNWGNFISLKKKKPTKCVIFFSGSLENAHIIFYLNYPVPEEASIDLGSKSKQKDNFW